MKKVKILTKVKTILPSKKITILLGVGIVFILILFILFNSSGHEKFTSIKNKSKLENKTIEDFVQADTDLDGVFDWEEGLWGTDKNKKVTFEPMSDAEYIENKKKELKLEQDLSTTENTETETDKFAQDFFTTYLSLKTGGVDQELINNFSNSLGQKLASSTLLDKYVIGDVKKTLTDTPEEVAKYYVKISDAFTKGKENGIGDELEIVSNGLIAYENTQSANLENLILIAEAYIQFAQDVITIPVPESLAEYHLAVANGANNTGISVSNMKKVVDDPVIGISGISQYEKYSEDLIKAETELQKEIATMLNQ